MNVLVDALPTKIIEQIKSELIDLFDKTLQEQASVFTDKLSGQISDSMKLIFQGPAVQKEATLMFNSHIFPVYDRIMKDHVTILQAVQKENGELRTEVDKLTTALADAGNDANKQQNILSEFQKKITNLFSSPQNNDMPRNGGGPDSTTNPIDSFEYKGGKQTESYIGLDTNSEGMMASVMANTNSALNEFGGAIKEQEVVAAKADAHRIEQGHFGKYKSCNSIMGGAKKRNKTKSKKSSKLKNTKHRKSRRV